MSIKDSLVLDWSELKLKWAVEDLNLATEKLIALLETQGDYQTIKALRDYLNGVAKYVMVADNIRKDLT